MYVLKTADYSGDYCGFHLKEGYLYGTDTTTGCEVASSGWTQNNRMAMYFNEDGRWKMRWVDINRNPELKLNKDIAPEEKAMFVMWLDSGASVPWEEWKAKYNGTNNN